MLALLYLTFDKIKYIGDEVRQVTAFIKRTMTSTNKGRGFFMPLTENG